MKNVFFEKDGFTFLNNQVIEHIFGNKDFHASDKMVLISLLKHVGSKIAPSQGEIADRVNISRRAVQTSVKKLVELGYLKRKVYLYENIQTVTEYEIGPVFKRILKDE